MQTYVVYFGLLILSILFARKAEKTEKRKFAIIVVLITSLVAGLRKETVGLDTQGYITDLENIIAGRLDLAYGLEWSFRYICYALSFVLKDPQLFIILFSLITNALIIMRLWDLRKHISFSWAFFAYFTMFYMMSLNLMRQFLALSFVFYGTKYLLKGKDIKFLIFVLCATLIHQSALIGILYEFFDITAWKYISKSHKRILKLGLVTSPFIFVYLYRYLSVYNRYFTDQSIDFGFLIIIKLFILVVSCFMLDCKKIKNNEETKIIRHTSIASYSTGLILTSLGYIWRFVSRIGLFFYVFESVYLGYIFKQENTRNNIIIKMVITAIFSYLCIGSILGKGQGQAPYLFYWQ